MSRPISIVQYWGGCPQMMNSKWQRFLRVIECCVVKGWRTYLVWSRMPEDTELSRPFQEAGCEIILQRRPNRNFDLRCVLSTCRMLRKLRCDVFHCHNVHTSPLIGAALAGVPVRIWSKLAMSPYYEQGIHPTGIHRLMPSTRVSCCLAHRILALTSCVAEELHSYGVSPAKVEILPAPVDIANIDSALGNAEHQVFAATAEDLLITSVGHAVPVKGWDILIRAYAQVVQSVPNARLLLVGSTSSAVERKYTQGLKSLAESLGVLERITFAGQCADIPGILQSSDIFAFPSRSEGQGLALVEAMAVGLPCVASRTGGIPDVVEDGVDGLLFHREDPDDLASVLLDVISNTSLRRLLGKNARQKARQFSMKRYVDRLMLHYDGLLGC